jgi:two-component system cell cycle sensor histidine kinase/response regulator CckA
MEDEYEAADQFVQEQLETERLRESARMYNYLLQAFPDAIVVTDLEGKITYASPQALEMYGVESDKYFLGKSPFDFIAPEDHGKARKDHQKILEEGMIRDLEYTLLRADGTRVVGDLTCALVRDASGDPEAFIGIVRELTENRRMTNGLYESVRTPGHNPKPGIPGRRAVSSGKLSSIGRLSLNLVHELSNPLDGVRRYIKLLADQTPKMSKEKAYAELALDGLARISKMVRGILDFAREEPSVYSPKDVHYSIEKSLSSLREELSRCKIRVKTEFGKDLPASNVDMERITTNIVRNAIQAMTDGGTLLISAKLVSPRMLEIRFADTGPGIPDEIREKIFEPFFTTKNHGQCIGLGLSMCRELVEGHDGRIDVESEIGKGTTLTVRLPLYKGRILVMDDEKSVRDLTSDILSRSGYRVATAVNGDEAIELYKEAMASGQPYDAVILDLVVPGSIGAARALEKLLEIDPDVKAIACSAYQNEPILSDFREYGFKAALFKPYTTKGPDEVVQEVMAGTDD